MVRGEPTERRTLILYEKNQKVLYFPILLFSSIFFALFTKKAFLSFLAILWNSTLRWIYLSFSPLPFTYLLSSDVCKASFNNHFAFLHFFFLGMVLNSASYSMLWTSVHSSSGILSDLIPWIYLSLSLNGPAVFPTFFNLSLNLAIRSSWSEPQSASGLVYADCIELLHLWLQRI